MSTLQLILVIYEQENREMPIFSLGLCNFPRIISILLSKNEENHAIAQTFKSLPLFLPTQKTFIEYEAASNVI